MPYPDDLAPQDLQGIQECCHCKASIMPGYNRCEACGTPLEAHKLHAFTCLTCGGTSVHISTSVNEVCSPDTTNLPSPNWAFFHKNASPSAHLNEQRFKYGKLICPYCIDQQCVHVPTGEDIAGHCEPCGQDCCTECLAMHLDYCTI